MPDADALLQKTLESISSRRRRPEATYRLQFHAGFTFRDACRIVSYLRDLGITHVYASPYLKARPGSTHGYDITDHHALNPEIGSEEDFAALVSTLKQHGLGQILDTVPNHMGVTGNENTWWNDVLENGPASPFADFFDISWDASPRAELHNRLLLPVLGEPYGEALESGKLRVEYGAGAFTVCHYDARFPIDPSTYDKILGCRGPETAPATTPEDPAWSEYHSILTAIKNLPSRLTTDAAARAERQREKVVIKRRLAALLDDSKEVRALVDANLALFNGTAGNLHSFDLLDNLLDQQVYRLSFWRVASDEINYRRFFDVNELAALSMEREDVFLAAHELSLRLLREGTVDGLRIDHPDGLFDPLGYLCRLQRHFVLACARDIFDADAEFRGLAWEQIEPELQKKLEQDVAAEQGSPGWRPLYVVVEKILGRHESLPDHWPTDGTSGYDFLNMLNGLFVECANSQAFTDIYRQATGLTQTLPQLIYRCKFLILQISLASELYMLSHQLDRLAQKGRGTRDFTLTTLRHALREVIACFPVYRSYIVDGSIRDANRAHVNGAMRLARGRNPEISPSVFNFLQRVLLLEYPETATAKDRAEQQRFVGKFQQVTSPVMAKGVEDTAFYIYNRLLSLNEVGGDPDRFGVTTSDFHHYNLERRAKWPFALSATSTHDTKRSEDVRARLNVLSELPDEWRDAAARWTRLNEPLRERLDDELVPDANEEYLLYQTLIGAWPLEPCPADQRAEFVQRVQAYMVKALHEAKVHSSWINPIQAYDEAVQRFVASILDEEKGGDFLQDFKKLQLRVSHFGLLNSLSQTLLKIAAPGAPDTYQGTEVWDFSLVDPDNRRPVNYELRGTMLKGLQKSIQAAGPDRRKLANELLAKKVDGRIKLYVTSLGLLCRSEYPGLFTEGEYIPLRADGPHAEHVVAFTRRHQGSDAIVVVPRLLTQLVPGDDGVPMGRTAWQETALVLPAELAGNPLVNVFTGARLTPSKGAGSASLAMADVLADFPVTLLIGREQPTR
ncbi:MAG: malto-oligosyltrehalose synthase [Planctomycetia bacterium]|nr:malto-oligosyltrehalose synthase [Planctomycetia bacterium]